ncbi:MAG: hypothetical protein ACTS4U_01820 [Candidatus Hodgkinia cicadicola]
MEMVLTISKLLVKLITNPTARLFEPRKTITTSPILILYDIYCNVENV